MTDPWHSRRVHWARTHVSGDRNPPLYQPVARDVAPLQPRGLGALVRKVVGL